ncbi:MAG: proteasome ATPase [Actinobacteria bacterium]|nr:proteasome ATPase [Actinomycetota bacterium]MCL6105714.1 proteasome ATPase [Actinomycetota bacterium]
MDDRAELEQQLIQAQAQNRKLISALSAAKEHLETLRNEIDTLTNPPLSYGIYVGANSDGTFDVVTSGRKMRVKAHPSVNTDTLYKGQEVVLNDSFNIVTVRDWTANGEVVCVKEVLDDGVRAIVELRGDEEHVAELADNLLSVKLRAGDTLLMDTRTQLLVEKLPRPEAEELVLEEIPDVAYSDIGGLDRQIEQIVDAVELPFLHKELFCEYQLPVTKGILLYGPPGCGKTLIAKAVAHSLASKVEQMHGKDGAFPPGSEISGKPGGKEGEARQKAPRSYFLNVKGPELLNKYVGETERQIRMVFQRAKEKVQEGIPVIIFFDEMDSLFRTRGTGISSDVESTIVPQLLAEIDGVETLKDVLIIGASNREDLIDPAILRPGRLDVKIKIDRPDQDAAAQIFARYLSPDLPISQEEVEKFGGGDPEKAVRVMIEKTTDEMYKIDEENQFLEVTYQNGDREILYFKDFASGAMIENIVRRAKRMAVKRAISAAADGGSTGIQMSDLIRSIREEYSQNEDLPNTTNPDDWARISGKKGERIVYVRTILADHISAHGGRAIVGVTSATGQYL